MPTESSVLLSNTGPSYGTPAVGQQFLSVITLAARSAWICSHCLNSRSEILSSSLHFSDSGFCVKDHLKKSPKQKRHCREGADRARGVMTANPNPANGIRDSGRTLRVPAQVTTFSLPSRSPSYEVGTDWPQRDPSVCPQGSHHRSPPRDPLFFTNI